MTTATNMYEFRAHEKKARRLADFLMKELYKVAAHADEALWEATAIKAGTTTPSAETRKRVLEILRAEIVREP